MAGGTVIAARVVTQSCSCWSCVSCRGIERLVATGTAELLVSEAHLRADLKDVLASSLSKHRNKWTIANVN